MGSSPDETGFFGRKGLRTAAAAAAALVAVAAAALFLGRTFATRTVGSVLSFWLAS